MKYLSSFLFLLCMCVGLHAQISISNEYLTKPDEKIAYSHNMHKMKINGLSEQDTNLTVLAFDCIMSISKHSFFYFPRRMGHDTIIIMNNGKEIHRDIYIVERSPCPIVFLRDIRDSIVTKEQLLKNPGFVYEYDFGLLIPKNDVASFFVYVIKKNGKEKVLKTMYSWVPDEEWGEFDWKEGKIKGAEKKSLKKETFGSYFSLQQLKQIQKMKSGQKIRLRHVKVFDTGCNFIRDNLVLTIK